MNSAQAEPVEAPSIADAIRVGAERLASVSDTARLDAELLIASALGVSRTEMLLRHLRDPAPPGWDLPIAQRAKHVPVAHLLGRQEFWGLSLGITPDVLIPRGDSETIVRTALTARPDARRVLDLGTGSGALLLALLSELPLAQGIGIDASPRAVAVATSNAADLGFGNRARIEELDWSRADQMARLGRFDLIVSNPPYVEDDADLAPEVRDHEPGAALFAGPDGLDAYRVLIPQLPALLEPKGVAVIEIGSTQGRAVTALAAAAGFSATLHRDLGGRPRALELKKQLGFPTGTH